MSDVEPAGKGAKGGQDQSFVIVDKAGSGQRTVVGAANAGLWVPMPGNLAGQGKERGGFVAEVQRAECEVLVDFTAEVGRNFGIVVARNPDKAFH